MAVFVCGLALACSIQLFIVVMMMMGDDDGLIYVLLPTPDCAGVFSSGSRSKKNDMIVLLLLVSIELKISSLLLMFMDEEKVGADRNRDADNCNLGFQLLAKTGNTPLKQNQYLGST